MNQYFLKGGLINRAFDGLTEHHFARLLSKVDASTGKGINVHMS